MGMIKRIRKSKKDPRPQPMDEIFGRNVRALREDKDMSQEQLSEIMSITKGMLSGLENGKRPWNSTTMTAASNFFQREIIELMGGEILSKDDKKTLDLIRAVQRAEKNADSAEKKLASAPKGKTKH